MNSEDSENETLPVVVQLQRIIDNRYYVSDLEYAVAYLLEQESDADYESAKERINNFTPFELLQVIFTMKNGMMEKVNQHEKLLEGVGEDDLCCTISSVEAMERKANW